MNEWTDGYVADMTYTPGFYPEMTPGNLVLVNTLKSMRTDNLLVEPFTYCELGFGRGLGLTMMAAGHPNGQFWGVDLNPSHVLSAQRLARLAGLQNLTLLEGSFRQFRETSTPSFDIIALHGIYSWVSPENRQQIVSILADKLKPGGMVYISYNTLPGWGPLLGLRHLLTSSLADQALPTNQRIEKALQLANTLQKAKAGYFAANPAAAALLEQMKGLGRNYLAHEYFNRDWHPQFFSEVVQELSHARLTFLGSAHVADHFDQLNLSAEAIGVLDTMTSAVEREGMRDFFVEQRFRRDLFIRGMDPMSASEQSLRLRQLCFTLTVLKENVSLKAKFRMGEFSLDEKIYHPIILLLSRKPHTLDELLVAPETREIGLGKLVHAISILSATGQVSTALDDAGINKRLKTTQSLNQAIMQQTRLGADWPWLVSPVTGGGIAVNQMEQLFLHFLTNNNKNPIADVWQTMQGTNQRLVVQGNVLKTPEENLQELQKMLDSFVNKRMPLLRQLGIVTNE